MIILGKRETFSWVDFKSFKVKFELCLCIVPSLSSPHFSNSRFWQSFEILFQHVIRCLRGLKKWRRSTGQRLTRFHTDVCIIFKQRENRSESEKKTEIEGEQKMEVESRWCSCMPVAPDSPLVKIQRERSLKVSHFNSFLISALLFPSWFFYSCLLF